MSDGAWGIQGTLEGTIPDAVGQLVASILDTLETEERRVLEAASVVGATFAVAPVATATGLSADAVEAHCAHLARQRRLVEAGIEAWPDGTVSGRYEFAHAVYADVLYGGLTAVARSRLHRALGERIEAGHRGRIGDVAAVLARHFELAGDLQRAMHFHGEAALAARQRCAPHEAISHLEAALALLRTLPATDERTATELDRLIELGGATVAIDGYSVPKVAAIYERACELATRLDMVPAQIIAIGGLYTHHVARAELLVAREKAQALLALAERASDPLLAAVGHAWFGFVLFNLGEFEASGAYLEQARAAWISGVPRLPGHGMSFRGVLALTLLVRGKSSQAGVALQAMLDCATELGDDPFNHAQAHGLAAQFYAISGAREPALHHAEQSLALATEHGFPVHRASAMVVRGWAVGDLAGIRRGLSIHANLGHRLARSLFDALLAETLLAHGDPEAALETVAGALAFADATGEARHLAELHRLRAECLLRRHGPDGGSAAAPEIIESAVASLRTALDVARRQKATLWEQRALTALRSAARRQARARQRVGTNDHAPENTLPPGGPQPATR